MAVALFIGSNGLLSAAALRGWLEAGNEVAEYWSDYSVGQRLGLEAVLAPRWTVAGLLRQHGIVGVSHPRLRDWPGAVDRIRHLGADTLITAVTMQILKPPVLEQFGRRAVNFHPALLPEYRGPSPFLGTILDGRDECAGATLHVLSEGIDEGPIIGQIPVPYTSSGQRYSVWCARHAEAFRRLARDTLPAYLAGEIEARPQAGGSYRRVRSEIEIGPHRSSADVRRLLELAGDTRRIGVHVPGRKRIVSLKRLSRAMGPPTGTPPRLRLTTLELDLADARVRFTRNTNLDRQLDQLATLAELARPQL